MSCSSDSLSSCSSNGSTELFENITKNIRRAGKHKKAIFVCGAAGTGKTSGRPKFLEDAGVSPGSYVYLNPDELGGNQSLLTHLLQKAVSQNYSFVFDATCRNRRYVSSLMKSLKGYKIILCMTYASLETALQRVKQRVSQPVPEPVVRDIYRHMKKNAETYMKLSFIDELYLYNNEETSKLIFHKSKKRIECVSPGSGFYFDVSKYCPKE